MSEPTFGNLAWIRIAVLSGLFAVWGLASSAVDKVHFPGPITVMKVVWSDWIMDASATWSDALAPSLFRLILGFALASLGALGLGVAIGRSRTLGDYTEPIIHFVRAIPPPALLPLFIVLFGIGDLQKIVLISIGVFPPILLNTIDGVRSVDPLLLDTAASFRVSRARRIYQVVIPAAAPKIFAGLRIAIAIAVILMVISELVAATNGLGFRIVRSSRQFKYVDVWAGIVVLGVLGSVLNGILGAVERRVLGWNSL